MSLNVAVTPGFAVTESTLQLATIEPNSLLITQTQSSLKGPTELDVKKKWTGEASKSVALVPAH